MATAGVFSELCNNSSDGQTGLKKNLWLSHFANFNFLQRSQMKSLKMGFADSATNYIIQWIHNFLRGINLWTYATSPSPLSSTYSCSDFYCSSVTHHMLSPVWISCSLLATLTFLPLKFCNTAPGPDCAKILKAVVISPPSPCPPTSIFMLPSPLSTSSIISIIMVQASPVPSMTSWDGSSFFRPARGFALSSLFTCKWSPVQVSAWY